MNWLDVLSDGATYLAIAGVGGAAAAAAWKFFGWKQAAAVAVVTLGVLGAFYVLDLQDDKARVERELTETKAALERERKQTAAVDKGTEAAEKVIVTVTKTVDRIVEVEREVADAPPSEDGPVAPVLKRALDGLREQPN